MTEILPLSAATRVAGVIGHPVRHSLSPVIYNAAFRATGLDWAFVAFDVEESRGADAIRACRALGLEGLSVTMPHKDIAAATVDALSDRAATLGAVNCIRRRGDQLVGDNTDGPGFVAALRAETDFDPAGRRCAVLGAGGAARAIVLALADAGAHHIAIVNRTPTAAAVAASLAPDVAVVGTDDAVADADLVVNATSLGMTRADERQHVDELPVAAERLAPGQIVADIVYHPLRTRLLEVAGERGATTVGGLGMLVHQAGLAFTIWTGEDAPLEAMWSAAHDAIRTRG